MAQSPTELATSIEVALKLGSAHPGISFERDDLELIVKALRGRDRVLKLINAEKYENDKLVVGPVRRALNGEDQK